MLQTRQDRSHLWSVTTWTVHAPVSAAAFAQWPPSQMLFWCPISSLNSDKGLVWAQPGRRAQNHPVNRALSAHQSTPYPNPNALLSTTPNRTRRARCRPMDYLQTAPLSLPLLCPPPLHPAWHERQRPRGAPPRESRTGENSSVLMCLGSPQAQWAVVVPFGIYSTVKHFFQHPISGKHFSSLWDASALTNFFCQGLHRICVCADTDLFGGSGIWYRVIVRFKVWFLIHPKQATNSVFSIKAISGPTLPHIKKFAFSYDLKWRSVLNQLSSFPIEE